MISYLLLISKLKISKPNHFITKIFLDLMSRHCGHSDYMHKYPIEVISITLLVWGSCNLTGNTI